MIPISLSQQALPSAPLFPLPKALLSSRRRSHLPLPHRLPLRLLKGSLEEDIETTIQIAMNLVNKTSTTFGASMIAPSNNKPTVPTVGGLTALSKDEWSAWTGGKPKADWSGLADHTFNSTSPNQQLTPIYVSAAQKGYNYHRTGLKDTFKPTNDLIAFQNSVSWIPSHTSRIHWMQQR